MHGKPSLHNGSIQKLQIGLYDNDYPSATKAKSQLITSPPVVVDDGATVHWLVICRSIKMTV
jgi:hypothetical protein